MKYTATNICVQVFVGMYVFNSLEIHLEVEQLGHIESYKQLYI